jgi:hypothetical protein
MLGDDGFVRLNPPLLGGLDSWPPDLFNLDTWQRLQELNLKTVTVQDEFFLAEIPRAWTTIERKYALIIRDPLTRKFDKKLLELLRDQGNESLSGEVNRSAQELEGKWNFRIHIPRAVQENPEEALSRLEAGLIYRPWRPIFAKPQAIKDLRKQTGYLIMDQKTRTIINIGYENTGLIYCPPPLIPLAFDPTMLTHHDIDMVVKTVKSLLVAEIKKSRGVNRTDWTPVAPGGEPEELAKVLRCRPENFEKYLRWFDLHMAGIPFRLIAHYESTISDPEKREAVFEKVIVAKKTPKVRKKVKTESAVTKGHDLILFAIYRKRSVSDEDKVQLFGEYKCPDHEGNNCPVDCGYLIGWMKSFDRTFKDAYPREFPTDAEE